MARFFLNFSLNHILLLLLLFSFSLNVWLASKPTISQPIVFNKLIWLEKLKGELQLSHNQLKEFEILENEILLNNKQLWARINSYQSEIHLKTFQNTEPAKIADLARNIAETYYQKEWLEYRQLIKLQKICNEQQREILKLYLEHKSNSSFDSQ